MAKWNAKNHDLSFGREHTAKSWQLSVTAHKFVVFSGFWSLLEMSSCGSWLASYREFHHLRQPDSSGPSWLALLQSGCFGNRELAPLVLPAKTTIIGTNQDIGPLGNRSQRSAKGEARVTW